MILKRFKTIMAANVNALCDKAEDPEKMIAQYMRELSSDLRKTKQQTAGVMADEAKAKRELEKCQEQISSINQYAEAAVRAGNDEDARSFLVKVEKLETKAASLEQAYAIARENSNKMRQLYYKLQNDIEILEMRRSAICAKASVAKAVRTVNKVNSNLSGGIDSNLSGFDRMEVKADHMLDTATAWSELDECSEANKFEQLKCKYSMSDAKVDEKLLELKAKLGMPMLPTVNA